VVLTRRPAGLAARLTHYLARVERTRSGLPAFEIVGAVIDRQAVRPPGRRHDRLRAWHRHGGVSYVAWRLWLRAAPRLRRLTGSAERPPEHYGRTLRDLGAELGFPVVDVPTLNGEQARQVLRDLGADVALSVENQPIGPPTFSVPPGGILNLHYGRLPDFRGQPPGFWELHDGSSVMGLSVHRIDEHLDRGQLLGRAEVPVRPGDDTRTLFERALEADHVVVEQVLRAVAAGTAVPMAVEGSSAGVRTLPSPAELRSAARRQGRRVEADGYRRAALREIPVPRGAEASSEAAAPG
jgi:hypothetical protein